MSSPILRPRLLALVFAFLAASLTSVSAQVPGKFLDLNPKDAFDKVLNQQVGKMLGEELPLTLNAKNAYPTVANADLPGGPFHGKVIETLSPDMLTKPLPPGDYILPMTFFCSEYGAHQPNDGMAYTLGPAEGKLSTPIATLLWRGMMVGKRPQELQMISWAIQASLPYSKMPPDYQKTIDQLLPDFKGQLNGQGFTQIKNGYDSFVTANIAKYNSVGRAARVLTLGKVNIASVQAPTLETVLARLGPTGHLAIDAERQASLISANYVDEEKREQTVFAGQGTPAPPQPAIDTPWSVKVPDHVFMRFLVKGGNLEGANQMQIRVIGAASSGYDVFSNAGPYHPRLQLASYQVSPATTTLPPTMIRILGGVVNEAAFLACVAGTKGGNVPLCQTLATTMNAAMTAYAIGKDGQAPIMVPTAPITPPVMATKEKGDKSSSRPPRPGMKFPQSELPTDGERPYVPPKQKSSPEFVTAPGGGNLDTDGNVWKWAKDQHGGPHWDVQHPDGDHTNVSPEGSVIGGPKNDNFPNKPRVPK